MARNVEIKARIESLDALEPVVRDFADNGPIEIRQDDTFFPCQAGRLKLRDFGDGSGELIFYQRADVLGPKLSQYTRSASADPATLRSILTQAMGQSGRVVKRRTLYLAGRTRIHLDRVLDLGNFLELEVVLQDGEAIESGIAEANGLLERLGVDASQLTEGSYFDLLAKARPYR